MAKDSIFIVEIVTDKKGEFKTFKGAWSKLRKEMGKAYPKGFTEEDSLYAYIHECSPKRKKVRTTYTYFDALERATEEGLIK